MSTVRTKRNYKFAKNLVSEKDGRKLYKRKCKKNKKILRKLNKQHKEFYFSESIFYEWFNKNIDRFLIKPIKHSNGIYYFQGVIKNVYLRVDLGEFGVGAIMVFDCLDDTLSKYDSFDHIDIEYIGFEAYDFKKGFYDADRIDGIFDYFETRKELYITNVFEYIIKYCNTYLVPTNSLYLTQSSSSTTGKLAPTKDKRYHFEKIIPFNEKVKKEFYESKLHKCIKYDLFDESKEPDIGYF